MFHGPFSLSLIWFKRRSGSPTELIQVKGRDPRRATIVLVETTMRGQRLEMKAISIIRDEHRSLAAVLHGMLYLVREIGERGKKPDFRLLAAMMYYIDTFPERFHHPKEDRYLFRILGLRHPAAGGTTPFHGRAGAPVRPARRGKLVLGGRPGVVHCRRPSAAEPNLT